MHVLGEKYVENLEWNIGDGYTKIIAEMVFISNTLILV